MKSRKPLYKIALAPLCFGENPHMFFGGNPSLRQEARSFVAGLADGAEFLELGIDRVLADVLDGQLRPRFRKEAGSNQ